MRIDGITTCVGKEYRDYLIKAFPIWWEKGSGFNSLTIVTKKDSEDVRELNKILKGYGSKFRVVETNAFGEYFNKGAALNVAFKEANPTDWVLAFDCDILPPETWRWTGELKVGNLYGAYRYNKMGTLLDKQPLLPKGYFQLWNVNDPHYCKEPIFIEWCEHAGRYDTIFANQWPKENHKDLDMRLFHQGKRSKNWYGPGTTEKQMRKAFKDFTTDRSS